MKTSTTLFLVAAVATGAWFAGRASETSEPAAAAPTVVASVEAKPAPAVIAQPSHLGASAVLSIDPRALARSATPPVPVAPTLMGEFLKGKNLRALYDRLKNTPEGETAEGKLVLYELLQQCASVTDGNNNFRRPPQPGSRDTFVNNIPANDPQRDRRIAAFDANSERCAGFADVAVTRAELNKLLADSAAAGDSRAAALAMEQALFAQRRAGGGQATLSDAQVDQLRTLAGTRDPEAIRIAGRILAMNWGDYSLRIGPDQTPVEGRALLNAFALLGCDFGGPCGSDNQRLLMACANQGHCDAQSLTDFLYYYGSTPHDSQLLAQYQQVLRRAIETGDWSQLTVVRPPTPAPARPGLLPGGR